MFCCFADLNTEQARNYYRMGPEDQYESVGINFFSLDTIVSMIVGMIAVCHVEYEARIILSRDSIDLCHSHAVGRALSEGDEGFSLESLSNRSICFTLVFSAVSADKDADFSFTLKTVISDDTTNITATAIAKREKPAILSSPPKYLTI